MYKLVICFIFAAMCAAKPSGLGLGLAFPGHGLTPGSLVVPHAVTHVVSPITLNAGISQASRVDYNTPVIGTVAIPSVTLATGPSVLDYGILGVYHSSLERLPLGTYGLGNVAVH